MVTSVRFSVLLVAASAVGTAVAPSVATACGATPTPYVTLTEQLPQVRTGLPRDGAVVIRGKFWGPSGGPIPFADVRLLDEAGNPIPATATGWFSSQPSLAYRWNTPLPSGTRITVEAVVPAGVVKPTGADGPLTTRFIVETGEALTSPVALAGPLRVSLERFDADLIKCDGRGQLCGVDESCKRMGTRRAVRARIVVPAMTGGVDFDGYRGWLRFTDDHPATFNGEGEGVKDSGNVNLMHWIDVRPGEETQILQEIFDEEKPYAPCFALNLWDAAGHAVQAQPVCLPVMKASEYLRDLDRADQGHEVVGGCSAVPGPGNPGGLIPLSVGLAALWLRRCPRRR